MHSLADALVTDGVHAGLDELAEADVSTIGDRALLGAVRAVHEAEARLAAQRSRLVAEMDARGAYRLDEAQTAAQWISHSCRVSGTTGRREVRTARSLRQLPQVADALAAGDLSEDAVERIVACHRNPRARAAAERDAELLATAARDLDWRDFEQVIGYWLLANDPDGSSDDAEARRQRRRFELTHGLDGTWWASGRLDPIAGAILDEALRRVGDDLYAADRAEASERLGREPEPHELGRTPQQRRADALVELAHRASTCPPDGRRPAPLVTVVVGYETFAGAVCELFNGTVLHPSDIARLLDHALIERIVFDGPDRVMRVGRQRFFTGALRRAIEVRDRVCAHPMCDAPIERCDIDHIHTHADGGPTSQENGRAYCPFHNHLRQRHPPPDDDDD